jgi:hypothetical protein
MLLFPFGNLPHTSILYYSRLYTIAVFEQWSIGQDLNNFSNNVLKPAAEKIDAPIPKGDICPIHSVSTWGVDDYRIK